VPLLRELKSYGDMKTAFLPRIPVRLVRLTWKSKKAISRRERRERRKPKRIKYALYKKRFWTPRAPCERI